MAYPRVMESAIRRDLELFPVVAVMGARQVGKSTLCRSIADSKGLAYCTLDDHDILEKASEAPEALLDDLGGPAFIDEVQRAPGLFLAIKAVVDRDQRPGSYLVSGSNQPSVSGGVAESLLGRATYRTLRPLTLSELRYSDTHSGWSFLFAENTESVLEELSTRAASSGELQWKEAVATGGFPRALAAPEDQRQRILNDYVEVFSRRDIQEILGVESPQRFERFLRLLSTWTGQELNLSAISKDLGIPVNTLRRWLDALERSYLVNLLAPYSRNASQRVIKAPKIFMVDPALALAASREIDPTGFHLETLVYNDLAVWKDGSPSRELFHWRLSGGQEVDFVLQEGRALLPVEMKASSRCTIGDAKHLTKFLDSHSSARRGIVLSSDHEIRLLSDTIIAAPWWSVL